MKLVVFVGPSVELQEARSHLDATFLPPVAQGDLYRAARSRPDAIGVIDGYFDRVPAVWHKEILWALSQGIAVFGAASMGALRAAELADFGMVGVGEIFKLFHQSELEDDDEVAVAHLPKEYGYRAVSEAMVNIRATVASAEDQRVVAPETAQKIIRAAKALHFSLRSYPTVLENSLRMGAGEDEIDRLRRWLPEGRVDRKRSDAIALLKVMPWLLGQGGRPDASRFYFEDTNAWQDAKDQVDAEPSTAS
jgi:hypothetical protein